MYSNLIPLLYSTMRKKTGATTTTLLLSGFPRRNCLHIDAVSYSSSPARKAMPWRPSTRYAHAYSSGNTIRYSSSSSQTPNNHSEYPFPDESSCRHFPIRVLDKMLDGADWDNRIDLQAKWPNHEKGWQVQVEWKNTPYGVGLFASEDIPVNTILRIGQNGYNLMQFQSVQDIEHFCSQGKDSRICIPYELCQRLLMGIYSL